MCFGENVLPLRHELCRRIHEDVGKGIACAHVLAEASVAGQV